MSNLLSQASLVMIPSGYKEDVVYSAIPTNGSGDLSFTRASNGTRVNSAGLVEVCPWNLLEQSETFDNAYWNKYQSVITANATTAPNGTTTADKLEYTTTGTAVLYTTTSALSNQVYALSCYGKKGTTDILQIGFTLSGGDKIANFNLNTGVITTTSSGVTASIESVGNGWFRCIMSLTTDINTPNIFVNSTSGTTGEYIYIYGAQLNIGSTAKPYFPTTDRLNVPRLTYQNGGGGCPSLLLEKQSTNVNEKSNDFTLAANYWYEPNSKNPTANQGTSPDGTNNAWSIQSNSFLTTEYGKLIGLTIGDKTAGSIWAKGSETAFTLSVRNTTNSDILGSVTVNLTTGAITSGSGTVESFGNGWYRISTIGTSTITNGYPRTVITNPNTSCLIYGSQFEASSYATSYIQTQASSATRVADACFKTGISSLIGQTEGVLFADFVYLGETQSEVIDISDGTENNRVMLYINSSSQFMVFVTTSGTTDGLISTSYVPSVGSRYKVAIAYKSNDIAFYVNGTSQGTDTSATIPATSKLTISNGGASNYLLASQFNQAVLFKTRLTNAELASLTTI